MPRERSALGTIRCNGTVRDGQLIAAPWNLAPRAVRINTSPRKDVPFDAETMVLTMAESFIQEVYARTGRCVSLFRSREIKTEPVYAIILRGACILHREGIDFRTWLKFVFDEYAGLTVPYIRIACNPGSIANLLPNFRKKEHRYGSTQDVVLDSSNDAGNDVAYWRWWEDTLTLLQGSRERALQCAWLPLWYRRIRHARELSI